MKNFFKNCFLLVIIFSIIFSSIIFADNVSLDLNGEGVLLVDYDSSRILYEKNSNEKLYPASTTKIMTAILAIELGNMDDIVEIDEEVVKLTEGSQISLDYDEKMRFEDLLNGLMVASANDAALAIAKHISGSIEDFVDLMNAKAKELGASNTNFVNPNGLHEDDHYSTAYDLFLITRYAMENESFREYASKAQYTIPPTNKKTEERLLHTTNKFLYGNEKMELDNEIVPIRYDGMKGIKTGTTPQAKNCLVSYAERDGKKMISIILKSEGLKVYADTTKLMDYGFDNFNPTFLGHKNEFVENLHVENGSLSIAPVILNGDINYLLRTDETERVEKDLKFKDKIEAPIVKGDVLGTAEFYLDGNLIAKEDIVSTIDINPATTKNLVQNFSKEIRNNWYIILIIFIVILLIMIRAILKRRRKNRKKRKARYK